MLKSFAITVAAVVVGVFVANMVQKQIDKKKATA